MRGKDLSSKLSRNQLPVSFLSLHTYTASVIHTHTHISSANTPHPHSNQCPRATSAEVMKNMTVSTLKNKDSFALQKGGGANLFSVPPLPPHGHKKFVVPSSIVAFKFQTRPYSTNERVNDESSAIRTTLYLYITNSRVDTSRHRVCTNRALPLCLCLDARAPREHRQPKLISLLRSYR